MSLARNRPASRSCMFAESGNGTAEKLVPYHRPRCTLAHSCASYDRDSVLRSRPTSISCTRVLHQGIRVPPPSLCWRATVHPRRRSLRLLPLRSSLTQPLGLRLSVLDRPATAARPYACSPGAPRPPMPKRAFSKLALSTGPPSPQARFVAGGPSHDWNQRSPPSACWRPVAAARLPRHCRLNSPSLPDSDNPHLLYSSITSGADPQNAALQGGPLERPPFASPTTKFSKAGASFLRTLLMPMLPALPPRCGPDCTLCPGETSWTLPCLSLLSSS